MGESPNDGQKCQSSCWRRECRKIKFQQCNKFAHATFIYSIVCSLFIFFYFVKLFWWNNLSRFNVACAACLTREQQRGGCSDKLIFTYMHSAAQLSRKTCHCQPSEVHVSCKHSKILPRFCLSLQSLFNITFFRLCIWCVHTIYLCACYSY